MVREGGPSTPCLPSFHHPPARRHAVHGRGRLCVDHDPPAARHPLCRRDVGFGAARARTSAEAVSRILETLRAHAPRVRGASQRDHVRDPTREADQDVEPGVEGPADRAGESELGRSLCHSVRLAALVGNCWRAAARKGVDGPPSRTMTGDQEMRTQRSRHSTRSVGDTRRSVQSSRSAPSTRHGPRRRTIHALSSIISSPPARSHARHDSEKAWVVRRSLSAGAPSAQPRGRTMTKGKRPTSARDKPGHVRQERSLANSKIHSYFGAPRGKQPEKEGPMFDFLPPFLKRLYQSFRVPYARGTRVRATPEPEPEIAASARERMFRVEIIQDAFCERRPRPERLFRKPTGHRDLYSWCDLEASRYPTTRHRCAHCTDARDLYRRANAGDWQAEVRLHRLATRASMRLLAERRAWAETRRRQRAARTPEPGPPPAIWVMLGWKRWRARRAEYPPATERWFIVERREAEAKLVRAHTSTLQRMAQRSRARRRDREVARDRAAQAVVRKSAQAPDRPAEPPSDAVRPDPPATPSGVRIALAPPAGANAGNDLKIGAARPTIPPPKAPRTSYPTAPSARGRNDAVVASPEVQNPSTPSSRAKRGDPGPRDKRLPCGPGSPRRNAPRDDGHESHGLQLDSGPAPAQAASLIRRLGLAALVDGEHRIGHHAGLLAHALLDRVRHCRMLAQERLGVLPPLADALAVEAEPRARLLDHAGLHAQVDQLAHLADALAVHDVELHLPERRRQLVLHHLHPGLVADRLLAFLDRADPPDLQPDRGVELQRVAARGGLRVAEHHADLQPDLVEEDEHRLRARHVAGQLAQRLAHQAGLQADMAVAHLTLELRARHQCRHAVDHHHVDRAGAHEGVADLQRLLAGVGLADQQIVDVHAELAGIQRIERVLGVDERTGAAALLRLGDGVQGQRGLARTLRAVDLDDAAARHAADAQRQIQAERARRDHLDLLVDAALAHAHDRALAEGAFDLRQRGVECLVLFHARGPWRVWVLQPCREGLARGSPLDCGALWQGANEAATFYAKLINRLFYTCSRPIREVCSMTFPWKPPWRALP